MLTGGEGEGWYQAARSVAAHLPVNLEAYRIGPQGELALKRRARSCYVLMAT